MNSLELACIRTRSISWTLSSRSFVRNFGAYRRTTPCLSSSSRCVTSTPTSASIKRNSWRRSTRPWQKRSWRNKTTLTNKTRGWINRWECSRPSSSRQAESTMTRRASRRRRFPPETLKLPGLRVNSKPQNPSSKEHRKTMLKAFNF